MKNLNKTAILPIVSVVCLAIAAITGHKFSADTIDAIATVSAIVVTSIISIVGVIKDHSKKEGK